MLVNHQQANQLTDKETINRKESVANLVLLFLLYHHHHHAHQVTDQHCHQHHHHHHHRLLLSMALFVLIVTITRRTVVHAMRKDNKMMMMTIEMTVDSMPLNCNYRTTSQTITATEVCSKSYVNSALHTPLGHTPTLAELTTTELVLENQFICSKCQLVWQEHNEASHWTSDHLVVHGSIITG